MTVKYAIKKDPMDIDNYLSINDPIPVSKDKIFRFYDGGTDNINNVIIEKITKIR